MAIVLPKFPRRRPSLGLAAETQPAVNVALCRVDGCYPAGGKLAARWRVRRVPIERIQGLEVSVLWHTEGKGDEDLHVHHFRRLGIDQLRGLDLSEEQSLECLLPVTPLSYNGKLITIRWCIRLRLFISDGREVVAEQPFHLVSAEGAAVFRDNQIRSDASGSARSDACPSLADADGLDDARLVRAGGRSTEADVASDAVSASTARGFRSRHSAEVVVGTGD